jgi:hypothetical protein
MRRSGLPPAGNTDHGVENGIAPIDKRHSSRNLNSRNRFRLRAAHARLGPGSLVLYDVSTLHFKADAEDGCREPGLSKERRLDPQITLGLLTDTAGFSAQCRSV